MRLWPGEALQLLAAIRILGLSAQEENLQLSSADAASETKDRDRHLTCDWWAATGHVALRRTQGLALNLNLRVDLNKMLCLNRHSGFPVGQWDRCFCYCYINHTHTHASSSLALLCKHGP